tara:strand:- start:4 stop:474 length:471 start_codon:yes stop_codon:yes gene_type:complete
MKNDEIYLEIKESTLCIICLEDLDNEITKICLNCDIECHNNCLRKWYKSKKQQICPICLKTKKYYQQKYKNDKNTIQSSVGNVSGNEMDTDLNMEDEIVLNSVEEDNEEEIINYYLEQINHEHSWCYSFIQNNCTYKKKISYLLIMGIALYLYGSY